MKAAILEQINAPLTVGEVGLTELGHGQVLVKVLVSGICGSQLQEIAGNKGNAKFLPHLMGHEGCGIVEAVGQDVTRVKKGDKVVMHWRKGEGVEADFPTYTFNGKTMKSGKVTTFNEYSIVSENRVTPVPGDIPNDLCALLGCSLSTAFGTIQNEARVMPGESVMIVGAGGLGVNLLKAAKMAGASPIISVDIHEHKREQALALGADLYINASIEPLAETLEKKVGLKNIQVIVDTSGAKKSLESTIPLLAGGGRFILVGQPKPGETIELTNMHHFFDGEGKTLKATQGGGFMPSTDIPKYLALYASGKLSIEGIITHRVKLDQINDAIDLVRNGMAGRVMIDISS